MEIKINDASYTEWFTVEFSVNDETEQSDYLCCLDEVRKVVSQMISDH